MRVTHRSMPSDAGPPAQSNFSTLALRRYRACVFPGNDKGVHHAGEPLAKTIQAFNLPGAKQTGSIGHLCVLTHKQLPPLALDRCTRSDRARPVDDTWRTVGGLHRVTLGTASAGANGNPQFLAAQWWWNRCFDVGRGDRTVGAKTSTRGGTAAAAARAICTGAERRYRVRRGWAGHTGTASSLEPVRPPGALTRLAAGTAGDVAG